MNDSFACIRDELKEEMGAFDKLAQSSKTSQAGSRRASLAVDDSDDDIPAGTRALDVVTPYVSGLRNIVFRDKPFKVACVKRVLYIEAKMPILEHVVEACLVAARHIRKNKPNTQANSSKVKAKHPKPTLPSKSAIEVTTRKPIMWLKRLQAFEVTHQLANGRLHRTYEGLRVPATDIVGKPLPLDHYNASIDSAREKAKQRWNDLDDSGTTRFVLGCQPVC